VKKAYKQQALRYHPGPSPLLSVMTGGSVADKNPDCDTSCIFTAVQSAYETLLQTAPPDPVTRHDHQSDLQQQVDPPKSAGRRSAAAEGEPVRRSPQKPQYHSTFRRKSSSSGPAEGPSQAPAEAKIDREQASGVAQMTTEQIRKSLQSIGVTPLRPPPPCLTHL
jgi:phage baseplate assembly protein W